ncbi:hypothetical protein [Formosa haliotis]|uniref:hypothetical protein n=1 Tax=Formosa haliotis TaxID=1555194 RepID=UPI000825A7CE|nr:hypothetical protein [Formosa haliotis]
MKKQSLIYITLLLAVVTACSTEDALEASNKDVDRVSSQLDYSIAEVERLYTNYNMGVLFEFDKNIDFAYVASSDSEALVWGDMEIPKVSTLFDDDETGEVLQENEAAYKQYKTDAVNLLDDTVFKYFEPNSMIAGYMPYKVLVSTSVFSPRNVTGGAASVLIESEARYSSAATSQLRSVYNDNALVFGVDLSDIGNEVNFSKDNFYIFFSRLLGVNNLYDQIPEQFYGNKSAYYGYEMEPVYRAEENIAEEKLVFVIDKEWFYEKGFITAKYFFDSGLGTIYQRYDEDGNYLGVTGTIRHYDAIAPDDEFFANQGEDVRSYLNEMIFRTSDEILAFPQNIQDNMKLLLDLFTSWGVDMVGVNPDLEVLN